MQNQKQKRPDEYWDKRYSSGGKSGIGSIGVERKWKWNTIDSYVETLDDVLDVGCGDISFWENRDCEKYIGIDISETIIQKNRLERPDWTFICKNAKNRIENLSKDVVLCLDVLFHIMNDTQYREILENLCYYSQKYIIIHTWHKNPFTEINLLKKFTRNIFKLQFGKSMEALKMLFSEDKHTDGKYQYFRNIETNLNIFEKHGFRLIEVEKNPNGISAMYLFQKSV
jgi:ubiquinone/menaquinone biosynthesis C-methylase UbiE